MEIIGLIAEYNPLHNGHLYHINKIKEKYPNSLLVLVLNGMRDFNLHSELLKAAERSLNLYGIDDEKLKKIIQLNLLKKGESFS